MPSHNDVGADMSEIMLIDEFLYVSGQWKGIVAMLNRHPRMYTVISLGLCVCAVVLISACTETSAVNSSATQTSAKPTATASPTPKHTPTPMPSPTPIQGTHGPTVLGAPISNFFGAYGSADVNRVSGYTWFLHDQNGNRVKWIGADYQHDGTVTRVSVVNTSDTAWSQDQSIGECRAFLPNDATFERWVDTDTQRYSSSIGEIQLWRENDMGDCLVFIIGS